MSLDCGDIRWSSFLDSETYFGFLSSLVLKDDLAISHNTLLTFHLRETLKRIASASSQVNMVAQ